MKIEQLKDGKIIIDGEFECFVYSKSNLNWINFEGINSDNVIVKGFKVFIESEISKQNKIEKFKSELKDLLIRYNGHIAWDAWGDLDGVHDEQMKIYCDGELIESIDGDVVCGDSF